ncbi:unnamed protein product [Rhodiola kirilowii]
MTRDQQATAETTIISALSSLTQHQLCHLTNTISAQFHHQLRRLSILLSSPILFSQTIHHLHSLSLPQKSLLLSRHLLFCLRHLTAPFTASLPPPPPLYSLRLHEHDSVLILLLLCELHQNDPRALQVPQSDWRPLLIRHMLSTMLNISGKLFSFPPFQKPFSYTYPISLCITISGMWAGKGTILVKYVLMVTRCLKLASLAGSDDDQCGKVAASRAAVVALPSVTIKAGVVGEELECVICREEMSEGRDVCELPCKHLFHWMCILKWVRKRNTCPCCRFRLPSDDVYGEIQRLWSVVVEKGSNGESK